MNTPEREPFRVELPLRHRDLDTLGHLNQAVYHELLEEVRSAFLREVLPDLSPAGYVLARVELDYRREVTAAHRTVTGEARVSGFGRSRVELEQRLLRPDDAVAAQGRFVVVAWDGAARRSRPLDDRERKALEAWT
ncbi:MAG: acyl-CoA thioesterase [Actinomycetota bacterium]|nr:acyl-CoA thioesterase [Actinomycetota bacterium]